MAWYCDVSVCRLQSYSMLHGTQQCLSVALSAHSVTRTGDSAGMILAFKPLLSLSIKLGYALHSMHSRYSRLSTQLTWLKISKTVAAKTLVCFLSLDNSGTQKLAMLSAIEASTVSRWGLSVLIRTLLSLSPRWDRKIPRTILSMTWRGGNWRLLHSSGRVKTFNYILNIIDGKTCRHCNRLFCGVDPIVTILHHGDVEKKFIVIHRSV